jgi:urease accessory protein
MVQALLAKQKANDVPRSIGSLSLSTKAVGGRCGIDRFKCAGATKVAFPRRTNAVEGIMLNTSGGLTGGDRFDTQAEAGPNSHLVLTTQAAERVYRSTSGPARVRTRLTVKEGARLHWLPQELIYFDGAAMDRQLLIEVARGSEAVMIEPVIFGRRAMGETRISGAFRDHITLCHNSTPIYWDRVQMTGDISAQLDRPAIARGLTALASGFYFGPRAEALLPVIQRALTGTDGASLIAPDLLVIRLLAADSFLLRQILVPVLECLTQSTLPKSWSL